MKIVAVATAVLSLTAVLLVDARCASAHAFLDHADPRVGATVTAAPAAVVLDFTEPVESDFCRIEVRDPRAQAVPLGALEHPQPEELRVSLPRLPPGDYTVHWSVTSIDTHQTEGRFEFTVAAP